MWWYRPRIKIIVLWVCRISYDITGCFQREKVLLKNVSKLAYFFGYLIAISWLPRYYKKLQWCLLPIQFGVSYQLFDSCVKWWYFLKLLCITFSSVWHLIVYHFWQQRYHPPFNFNPDELRNPLHWFIFSVVRKKQFSRYLLNIWLCKTMEWQW